MEILEDLIFPIVDEIQENLDAGIIFLKSPETPLLGSNSVLNSLDLVAFIIALEERINDVMGRQLILTDDKAMSLSRSPFRTIGTLAEYVIQRLGDEV